MEVRKGYKQTEVGVIPEDWETPRIDEVCRLINGRGFKPYEWKTAGLPIIRIQNLNGSDEFNYFDGSYDKKLEVESGQLLFAWSGSRGTSFGPHIWNGSLGLLNYHTWKVQSYDAVISKQFFLHALRQLTWFIEGKAHGAAALVHVQKWEMESFRFPIPPTLAEQEAIAEALSDADALIESLETLLAKKRQVKQGAMSELLTGKRRVVESPTGRLRTGEWKVKRLGDIGEIDPENLTSGTKSEYAFKYISLEDVDVGVLKNYTELVFRSAPSRARRVVRKGDILISTVRPNLKSHLFIQDDVKDMICSTGFSVLRCNPNIANPAFIFFHLFAYQIEKQIETLLTGSNYPAINSRDVKALQIPFPPLPEQTAIAEILSDMDKEIRAVEGKLSKARAVKAGMMSALLGGKIRLNRD
jgi:restriction endonuclease S subunit